MLKKKKCFAETALSTVRIPLHRLNPATIIRNVRVGAARIKGALFAANIVSEETSALETTPTDGSIVPETRLRTNTTKVYTYPVHPARATQGCQVPGKKPTGLDRTSLPLH